MKRNRIEFPVSYVIKITDWDWCYGFGPNDWRDDKDPYIEYRHLYINGLFVHPRKLAEENIKVQLTVMCDPKVDQVRRSQDEDPSPLYIGSLERRKEHFEGFITLPGEMLSPILTALVAKKLKFVKMSGEKLRRHKTLIRFYEISATFNEEDVFRRITVRRQVVFEFFYDHVDISAI